MFWKVLVWNNFSLVVSFFQIRRSGFLPVFKTVVHHWRIMNKYRHFSSKISFMSFFNLFFTFEACQYFSRSPIEELSVGLLWSVLLKRIRRSSWHKMNYGYVLSWWNLFWNNTNSKKMRLKQCLGLSRRKSLEFVLKSYKPKLIYEWHLGLHNILSVCACYIIVASAESSA